MSEYNGREDIIVIGLTGSIGMGKSTVAGMLMELGVPVHDSDEQVHKLMAPNGKANAPIGEKFPQAYDIEKGEIDRKALGKIIFHDDDERKKLEGILHPLVREAQAEFIDRNHKAGVQIVALDIPLLYETEREKDLDYVMVVSAPAEIQRNRVLARDNMTEEKFDAILKTQMPDEHKRERADYIIDSGVDMDQMSNIVEDVINEIKSKVLSNGHNRLSP